MQSPDVLYISANLALLVSCPPWRPRLLLSLRVLAMTDFFSNSPKSRKNSFGSFPPKTRFLPKGPKSRPRRLPLPPVFTFFVVYRLSVVPTLLAVEHAETLNLKLRVNYEQCTGHDGPVERGGYLLDLFFAFAFSGDKKLFVA